MNVYDPREFPCMDDTPNDGHGNLNLDHRYPDDGPNYSEDEPEEIIGDDDWIVFDDEFDTDWKNS